ncbi:MAG: DUF6785 family protein [Planctomycetota bacterium]
MEKGQTQSLDFSLKSNGLVRGVTVRSIAWGAALAVAINLASPYCEWILHSQLLTTNYFPVGLAFLFFVSVAALNPCLKHMRPGWGLTRGELAVVFVMLAVATTIPTYGVCGYWLATIAAPYYFATVENRWESYFHQYLPEWCLPRGGLEVRWFFEGLPRGETIPWAFWLPALLWWLMFIAFALFACTCFIVILRRQWMDYERLSYPLAEPAIAMIEGDSRPSPAFMRSWSFWFGFSICVLLMGWHIAGYFYPPLPEIPRSLAPLQIARAFPPILLTLYWPMVAIAFFIRLDVSFSIWFFVLLGILQEGVYNRFGFSITSSLAVYHYDASGPALAWQSGGAFVAMVCMMLWTARRHLRDVLANALGRQAVDDSGEIMSYRTAVVGLAVSMAFMVAWFCRLGMSLGASVLFNLAAVIIYLGLSRIIVEGGVVFCRMPLTAQSMTMNLLGNSAADPCTITAMGLSFAWIGDPICTFMPAAANALRVPHHARAAGRGVLAAIGIALLSSFAAAIPFTLYMAYTHGGFNFGTWLFGRGAEVPYEYVVHAFNAPPGVEWNKLLCGTLGAVVMLVLTGLRHRFAWWPLNPIGFPIGTVFKVRWVVFPIFLGWLCRLVAVSFGGRTLLNKWRPFFLGVMLGWFFGMGVSVIVDWLFFFGDGHVIYWH